MQQGKDERIELRANTHTKAILLQAASALNKSVTEFLIESGLNAAAITLADRKLFALSNDKWSLFNAMLDAEPQERPNLKRLLSTPSIFD